jgi:hypothetical protein
MWHPLSAKVGNHFADKQRSLGRYSSLADSDHGVFFLISQTVFLIELSSLVQNKRNLNFSLPRRAFVLLLLCRKYRIIVYCICAQYTSWDTSSLLAQTEKGKRDGYDESNGNSRQNGVDFITLRRLSKCIRSCRNYGRTIILCPPGSDGWSAEISRSAVLCVRDVRRRDVAELVIRLEE